MFKKILMICLFIIVTALPVFAEYYQYRDSSGNVRFTDNLYEVPADQRSEIKTYESVQREALPDSVSDNNAASLSDSSDMRDETATVTSTYEQELQSKVAELDRLQSELNRKFQSLQAEKKKVEAQKPDPNASSKEMGPYIERVEELNDKIKKYKEQRDEFNQKVRELNSQITN